MGGIGYVQDGKIMRDKAISEYAVSDQRQTELRKGGRRGERLPIPLPPRNAQGRHKRLRQGDAQRHDQGELSQFR